MATLKYVKGQVSDAFGTLKAGTVISIKPSQPLVVLGSLEIVDSTIHPIVAGDGTYTWQGYANADMSPAGSYYIAQLRAPDGSSYVYNLIVPTATDGHGGDGTVGTPFAMTWIQTGVAPSASPQVGHVALMTVDGAFIEGQQTVTEAVLVSGIDATLGQEVLVTLTANRVMGVPLNGLPGQKLHLIITQGGAGGFALTFGAGIIVANFGLNYGVGSKTDAVLACVAAGSWVVASTSVNGQDIAPKSVSVGPPGGPYVGTALAGGADYSGPVRLAQGPVIDPAHATYGAIYDVNWITDAAITIGQAVLTSPSNGLKDSSGATLKAGMAVIVAGAGAAGRELVSTVLASPAPTTGSVTLAANAAGTVTGANACMGTDNALAVQKAINQQQTAGGRIRFTGLCLIVNPTRGAGLIPAPGSWSGGFTNATRPLVLEGVGMYLSGLVQGLSFGSDGLLGYATGFLAAQVVCSDMMLDGNYVGAGGGVISQNPGAGALVSMPWPFKDAAAGSQGGIYHQFERVRFYRAPNYVFQPTQGVELSRCLFDQVGQPDIASGGTHYDNLGSGQGDAIVIGCHWKDSSGNYADFVDGTGGAGHMIRLIMLGCVSLNHQIGGIFACGLGSIIALNRLSNNVAGSGIGYDSGTIASMKANNIVALNTLTNITVNASGLSNASFGDQIVANKSSDRTSYMDGILHVTQQIQVDANAIAGLIFQDRGGTPSWQWYGNGKAILNDSAVGDILAIDATGKVVNYGNNGLATQGLGLPAIYRAPAPLAGQTAAVASVAALTTPNDGLRHIYRIFIGINITTLGSGNINGQVVYTDGPNNARTCNIPLCAEAGTLAASANTADDWKGFVQIIARPNTSITITTAGTFTGCTYDVGGSIEQIL